MVVIVDIIVIVISIDLESFVKWSVAVSASGPKGIQEFGNFLSNPPAKRKNVNDFLCSRIKLQAAFVIRRLDYLQKAK